MERLFGAKKDPVHLPPTVIGKMSPTRKLKIKGRSMLDFVAREICKVRQQCKRCQSAV